MSQSGVTRYSCRYCRQNNFAACGNEIDEQGNLIAYADHLAALARLRQRCARVVQVYGIDPVDADGIVAGILDVPLEE